MAQHQSNLRYSQPLRRDPMAQCTHLTVARIFDINQKRRARCAICYRTSPLGWLWRCTQDHEGFLPSTDFYRQDFTRRYEHSIELDYLSPSIAKAASEGHYTRQELQRVLHQKEHLRSVINEAKPRPSTSSSTSTASSGSHSLAASATYSTLPSTDSDEDADSDNLQISQACRLPLATILEVHDDLENGSVMPPPTQTTPVPLCNYKVCHNCRPYYTDRSWLSLDGVLATDIYHQIPPPWDMQNRRLSDAAIVREIDYDGTERARRAATARSHNGIQRRLTHSDINQSQQDVKTDVLGLPVPVKTSVLRSPAPHLPRHSSSYNLAAIAASGMNDEELNQAMHNKTFPFENKDLSATSLAKPLRVTNDGRNTASPRPMLSRDNRRSFESGGVLKVPRRLTSTPAGESSNAEDHSAGPALASAPETIDDNDNDQYEKQGMPRIVISGPEESSPPPPPRTPTESIRGSFLGFRRSTPVATKRFLID